MSDYFPQPKIVAVIPCFNEQKHIYEVITKAQKYVDQVLVIDDGSHDRTADVSKQAGAMVISHSTNLGKGAALDTAFDFLRTLGCEIAIFLDGDGQHDPDDIPKIIKPILLGQADMVIGSRFINGSYQIPAYRKLGQSVLNIVTNLTSRVKVTDSQSGFRGFSSNAIKLMRFKEKGLSVESEMQFIAARFKLKVDEVPIKTIYDGKLKRSPIKHGFSVLFRVIYLAIIYYRTRIN